MIILAIALVFAAIYLAATAIREPEARKVAVRVKDPKREQRRTRVIED